MPRPLAACLALCCLGIACTAPPPTAAAGENWPEFRGANGTGLALDADLPAEFGEGKNVVWKTPIHGKGWSSPVVWGGKIWLTTATEDGKTQSVLCVDAATGEVLHDLVLFENAEPAATTHPTNSFASPSPAVEAGRVYVHFGHYGTACLDAETAKVLWKRTLESDEYRGPASSPVIVGDLLVVHCDGIDQQYVVALDKRTGERVWRTDRDIEYGTDNGDAKKAFGTPGLFEIGGRPHLVCPAAVETVAYDPRTGAALWRVRHGGMNASARPLYAGGLVLIAAGKDDTKLVAVRPDGDDGRPAEVVWKSNKAVSQKPSPIVVGDLLFMSADDGVLSCRDVATGEIHWITRTAGEFWASPVSDGERVYFFSKTGEVPVVAAAKELEVLAENKFDEGFHATPAIVGDSMFLRSRHHLYKVSVKK